MAPTINKDSSAQQCRPWKPLSGLLGSKCSGGLLERDDGEAVKATKPKHIRRVLKRWPETLQAVAERHSSWGLFAPGWGSRAQCQEFKDQVLLSFTA